MITLDWKKVDRNTKLKVVFYGRVSTEHEAQLEAFKNQMQWYYDQLQQHSNWDLVAPIEQYLDKGITGTQAKKRPGFISMIEDAKAGRFDMIVTREVCRFARNTVDTLDYVRKLKALNIQVYFVNDNIRTMQDNDGELKLTMMAMMAQEESRKISERVLAGQYISRKNGVLYGTGNVLGYTRIRKKSDPEKRNAIGDKSVPTFAIVPEEAETVRMIFNWYADGYGIRRIKTMLEIERRKNSSGEVRWFESSIGRLLSNPMYIGKQYQCQATTVDFLNHERKKNRKENYVLIEGDFEPIITEELFNKVQQIKAERQADFEGKAHGHKRAEDKWIDRLECGCGSRFQKYKWRTNASGEDVKGYACRHRVTDGTVENRVAKGLDIEGACNMPSIPAWKFDMMALKIFANLWEDKTDYIADVYSFIERCYRPGETDNINNRVDALKQEIKKLENKLNVLVELYTDGDITIERFRASKAEYKDRLNSIKEQLDLISKSNVSQVDDRVERLEEIKAELNSIIDYSGEEIDPKVISGYIDKVVVRAPTEFEWYINLYGDASEFITKNDIRRHNEPYETRAQKTLNMQQQFYIPFSTFYINFDEARVFKKKFGKYLRTNQWKDLTIKVYIR